MIPSGVRPDSIDCRATEATARQARRNVVDRPILDVPTPDSCRLVFDKRLGDNACRIDAIDLSVMPAAQFLTCFFAQAALVVFVRPNLVATPLFNAVMRAADRRPDESAARVRG